MMQNPCHSHKWYKLKIHVSPLCSQKAHIFGKLHEICQPFSNLNYGEMETPNFTANCAKSAQFANPHSESREISLIPANF